MGWGRGKCQNWRASKRPARFGVDASSEDEPKAGRLRCWIRGVGFAGKRAKLWTISKFSSGAAILASPRDLGAAHFGHALLGPKPRSPWRRRSPTPRPPALIAKMMAEENPYDDDVYGMSRTIPTTMTTGARGRRRRRRSPRRRPSRRRNPSRRRCTKPPKAPKAPKPPRPRARTARRSPHRAGGSARTRARFARRRARGRRRRRSSSSGARAARPRLEKVRRARGHARPSRVHVPRAEVVHQDVPPGQALAQEGGGERRGVHAVGEAARSQLRRGAGRDSGSEPIPSSRSTRSRTRTPRRSLSSVANSRATMTARSSRSAGTSRRTRREAPFEIARQTRRARPSSSASSPRRRHPRRSRARPRRGAPLTAAEMAAEPRSRGGGRGGARGGGGSGARGEGCRGGTAPGRRSARKLGRSSARRRGRRRPPGRPSEEAARRSAAAPSSIADGVRAQPRCRGGGSGLRRGVPRRRGGGARATTLGRPERAPAAAGRTRDPSPWTRPGRRAGDGRARHLCTNEVIGTCASRRTRREAADGRRRRRRARPGSDPRAAPSKGQRLNSRRRCRRREAAAADAQVAAQFEAEPSGVDVDNRRTTRGDHGRGIVAPLQRNGGGPSDLARRTKASNGDRGGGGGQACGWQGEDAAIEHSDGGGRARWGEGRTRGSRDSDVRHAAGGGARRRRQPRAPLRGVLRRRRRRRDRRARVRRALVARGARAEQAWRDGAQGGGGSGGAQRGGRREAARAHQTSRGVDLGYRRKRQSARGTRTEERKRE